MTKFETSPLRQLGLRVNVKNNTIHDFQVETFFDAPGTITIVISDQGESAPGRVRLAGIKDIPRV